MAVPRDAFLQETNTPHPSNHWVRRGTDVLVALPSESPFFPQLSHVTRLPHSASLCYRHLPAPAPLFPKDLNSWLTVLLSTIPVYFLAISESTKDPPTFLPPSPSSEEPVFHLSQHSSPCHTLDLAVIKNYNPYIMSA